MNKMPFTPPHEAIEKLITLAEGATPGPWRECRHEVLIGDIWAPTPTAETARYVAALSPEQMLPILRRVREDQLDLYNSDTYVIRSSKPDFLMAFFTRFGLVFKREQHNNGPEHWACQVGEAVLEIYPRA